MDPYSQLPQPGGQPSQPLPPPQTPQQPAGPPQGSPLDYLNSIAAPQRTATVSPLKLWGFIGGALLLVAIIFITLINLAGGSSPTDKFILYQYRLTQVSTIAKNDAKLIKSSDLRALSGSMNTILVGALSESNDQLSHFGLKKSKDPAKNAPIVEEFTDLTTKLENADLNNNFDQVYAREMAYQMASLVAEINAIEKASHSSKVKASFETAKKNIEPYIDQYNDFNNSQS